VEVVEQRPQGTEVERGETGPWFGEDLCQQWEDRRLGLAPSSRCEREHVLTGEDRSDRLALQWAQLPPAEAVDDVVLHDGVQQFEPVGHAGVSSPAALSR